MNLLNRKVNPTVFESFAKGWNDRRRRGSSPHRARHSPFFAKVRLFPSVLFSGVLFSNSVRTTVQCIVPQILPFYFLCSSSNSTNTHVPHHHHHHHHHHQHHHHHVNPLSPPRRRTQSVATLQYNSTRGSLALRVMAKVFSANGGGGENFSLF